MRLRCASAARARTTSAGSSPPSSGKVVTASFVISESRSASRSPTRRASTSVPAGGEYRSLVVIGCAETQHDVTGRTKEARHLGPRVVDVEQLPGGPDRRDDSRRGSRARPEVEIDTFRTHDRALHVEEEHDVRPESSEYLVAEVRLDEVLLDPLEVVIRGVARGPRSRPHGRGARSSASSDHAHARDVGRGGSLLEVEELRQQRGARRRRRARRTARPRRGRRRAASYARSLIVLPPVEPASSTY